MDTRLALIAGVALLIAGAAFVDARPWDGMHWGSNGGAWANGTARAMPEWNETNWTRPRGPGAFNSTRMEARFQELLGQVNDSSLRSLILQYHALAEKARNGTATDQELLALQAIHGLPMMGPGRFDGEQNEPRENGELAMVMHARSMRNQRR